MCLQSPSKINSPDRKDIKTHSDDRAFSWRAKIMNILICFYQTAFSHTVFIYLGVFLGWSESFMNSDAKHNLFDFSKTTIKNVWFKWKQDKYLFWKKKISKYLSLHDNSFFVSLLIYAHTHFFFSCFAFGMRFDSDVNQFAYIPWLNNNSLRSVFVLVCVCMCVRVCARPLTHSLARAKIESDGSWYTRRTSWSTYIPFKGRNQISEKRKSAWN